MPDTEPVISDFRDHGLASFKHFLPIFEIIMLIIIVVVIILALVFSNNGKKASTSSAAAVATTVCTNSTNLPVIKSAVTDIKNNDMTALKAQVTNIKKIANYQSDPNCLYPIVYYYINTSDEPNATKYLAELKAVYKNNYSQYLGQTLYISTMSKDVSNMKSIEQQNKANDTTLSPPAGYEGNK